MREMVNWLHQIASNLAARESSLAARAEPFSTDETVRFRAWIDDILTTRTVVAPGSDNRWP